MDGFQLRSFSKGKNRSHGFTLVELMVSIVISLVILGGVMQMVLASKNTYILQEQLARTQENARFALDMIANEIRMAGYTGCGGSSKVTNTLNSTSAWDTGYPGVWGVEASASNLPADFTNPVAGQDALVIRRGGVDESFKVSSHVAASATIHIDGSQQYPVGTVMMIADANCQHVGIFQLTGPNNNNSSGHVNHSTGNNATPGNCHSNLSDGYNCSTNPLPSPSSKGKSYGPGSSLMVMSSTGFYISNNADGVPSLFKAPVTAAANGTLQALPEEMLEGVEGLQLTYGVDTSGNDQIDRYQKANNVSNWDNVKSVRIELLLRSIDPAGAEDISVTFDGVTYNDRFVRQLVSSTVMIRNR